MAIYRLRVLVILHKSPQNLFNYTEDSSISNCTKAPELYKIVFLSQLASNFSELTADLSGVRFERDRAVPAVPSIPSRLQSPIAHFTVFGARFCGQVSF